MVDLIKPICYISMPAHCLKPQVASYSSSQTQDVCILLRRLGDVICEARDAADEIVRVKSKVSIANFPLALDIDVRPNWSYRVIVTLAL